MPHTEMEAPLGLLPDGSMPPTRMQSAQHTRDRIHRLILADTDGRSMRRAMVKGLVDGNPPYKKKNLLDAGRGNVCNVNWRVAESFLNNAIGAFYDIFSESPSYTTVELDEKEDRKRVEYSRIVTEEFQRLQEEDRCWDHTIQNSQYEMVLYGIGPLIFPDQHDFRPKSIPSKDLIVPDRASSDITTWEEAVVMSDYLPHQLYKYIRNVRAARSIGWDVEATRQAIIDAHPASRQNSTYRSWEWHQEQLKTRSFSYSADSNIIRVAHYYLREFPTASNVEGAISHAMVVAPESESGRAEQYLYFKQNRYDKWEEFLHPMYYDNLGGGLHYAVTGMGVKMFAALEFQNRLLCNMADKVFAPKVFFKPTSAAADQSLNIVRFSDYGKVPPGFDIMQHPVAGMIEDSLVFNREIANQVAANLSSYRQNLESKEGNPRTATEVQQRASEQARLGKTQLTRYYNQLDWLYAEKYRRAVMAQNDMLPGGKSALEFQKRCKDRGVPLSALRKVRKVYATRVVGQGSEFLRRQSLEFLLGMAGMLPESGRANLISDVIAARAGQFAVNRYFARPIKDPDRDEMLERAMSQVADMKIGVPAIVHERQDHLLFAQVFLSAAAESFQSVGQGGDPADVLRFVELAGQAIAQHVNHMRADPTRKNEVKEIEAQLKKLGAAADRLREQIGQLAQDQQQAQLENAQMMTDQDRKNFETMQEERRRNVKLQQDQVRKDFKLQNQLRQSEEKHQLTLRNTNNGEPMEEGRR